MTVDLGAVYRASWLVTNDQGAPVTPAAATYTVTVGTAAPVVVPVPLPPASPGLLTADFQTTAPGLHRGDWATTGPVSAGSDYFNVRTFLALFSLAEARDHLGYTNPSMDPAIRLLMGAVTRLVEAVVGTCVIRTFANDWIGGTDRLLLQLPARPLPNATAVTRIRSVYSGIGMGSPQWLTADLIARPDTGTVYTASRLPFWGGPWLADYQAGRVEIAENIVAGAKEVLWDLFGNLRGLPSDSEYPSAENVATVESLIPPGYEMPSHALELLEPDRMPAFG